MTKPALAPQKDIERICKAIRDAHYPLRKVVMIDGKVEFIIGDGDEAGDPLAAEIEQDRHELEKQIYGKK